LKKLLKLIGIFPVIIILLCSAWLWRYNWIESDCKYRAGAWTNVNENEWLLDTGISLRLTKKNAIPFAKFWDTENAVEAQTILAKVRPGQEVNVTQFHRRTGNPWGNYRPPDEPNCPRSADGSTLECIQLPYDIHYLHRPKDDWVIDQISSHGEGYVTSKRDVNNEQDIFYSTDGPYMPIYEGRFKPNGAYWFVANEKRPNWLASIQNDEKKLSRKLSTPEMRFAELQTINNLLKHCAKTKN
jgi:hypothetical protein